MSTCSNTGVRDFPIQRTATLSPTIIDAVKESFMIDVQWAQKSTAPEFVIDSNDKGFLREGVQSSQATTTTLRFQGNTYSLRTMQITKPLHNSFFTADLQKNIPAELVIVFATQSTIAEKYVIFSIPIFNGASSKQNPYLNSLLAGRLPGKPISLGTVLPEDPKFIAYSTCLSQLQNNKSSSVQARVLMFYNAIPFTQANELKKSMFAFRRNNVLVQGSTSQAFPDVRLPDLITPKTMAVPFTIDNENTFTQFIRSGSLKDSYPGDIGTPREDTTASYKCVPLNPDLHVSKDNKITVDTRKGELLSDVLAKRNADLKADLGTKSGLNADQVEQILAISFGLALGLLILAIVAYFISRFTASEGSFARGPWVVLPAWIKNAAPIVVVSTMVGLIGFGVGVAVVAFTR